MSNFETPGTINLQSGDRMPWRFWIPAAESSSEKGAIPYESTIASIEVIVYDALNNDVTSELISGTPSFSGNYVTIIFQYPITSGDGRYKVTIFCTLNTGYTRQFDFERIIAKNN